MIGKVNKIEMAGSGCRFGGEFLTDTIIQFNDGKVYERRVKSKQVLKHSKNIIDLIEVGDYVNGYKVVDFDFTYFNGTNRREEPKRIEVIVNNGKFEFENHIKKDDIKIIWTKEQLKSIEYNV